MTRSQAILAALDAIQEAIRDLGEVPSGHLYAHVMGVMSIDTYQAIINALEQAGKIKVSHHLITWVGGKHD